MATAVLVLALVLVPVVVAAGVVVVRRPFSALALYAFLVPFGSTIELPGPPPFDNVSSVVGVVCVAALGTHLLLGRSARTSDSLPAVWGLMVAAAALTTLWSVEPLTTLTLTGVLVSLVVLYVLVALTPSTPDDLRLLELALIASGVLVGAYAMYLAAVGGLAGAVDQRFVAAWGGSETGDVADPNVTAASLLLPFFVAVSPSSLRVSGSRRVLLLAAAGVTAMGILLTGSRGGLLALLAGMLILGWTSSRRTLAIAGLLVPVVAAILALAVAPQGVVERLSEDSDSNGRTDIWRLGLLSCPRYCLQGSGWGTFPDVHQQALLADARAAAVEERFQAHSIWLGILVEGGVLALALLVIGLWLTWRQTRRVPPRAAGAARAALLSSILAASLLSTFNFKYFWLVLMYVAVVARVWGRPNRALSDGVVTEPLGVR